MRPIVSIVIPVYNSERYISRCLDSVLAQDYSDFEAILVDDGSPDASGRICDEYALRDKRFLVIHQPNAGVSAARNRGIDAASGTWLTFVDSDDWIAPDTLSALVREAEDSGAQCVVGGYRRLCASHGRAILPPRFRGRLCDILLDMVLAPKSDELLNSSWGKLFSLELVRSAGVRFRQGMRTGEDALFVCQYFWQVDRISLLDRDLFVYDCTVENSASHRFDENLYQSSVIFLSERISLVRAKIALTPAQERRLAHRAADDLFSAAIHLSAAGAPFSRRTALMETICREQHDFPGFEARQHLTLKRRIMYFLLRRRTHRLFVLICQIYSRIVPSSV